MALAVAGAGLSVAPASAARQADRLSRLTCESCLLVDDRGSTMFAREADERLPNASTTKMVTALLVEQHAELDDVVTVSPTAGAEGIAVLGGLDLHAGDRYTVEGLLYALLLASSNEAAVALAEHVAGSEAAFVADMNAYATTIGATGTRFRSAHGLDEPGHYSTARDLALIAEILLDNDTLAAMVGAAEVTIAGPQGDVHIENRNPLLETYEGAIGVKTGQTAAAGDVLVAAARRGGRVLIAVAMRSDVAAADARRLLDHGFRRLAQSTVALAQGDVAGNLVFDPGGATIVTAGDAVHGLARPEELRLSLVPDPALAPPIERGEIVGEIVVGLPDGSSQVVPAIAGEDVELGARTLPERVVEGVLGAAFALADAVGLA